VSTGAFFEPPPAAVSAAVARALEEDLFPLGDLTASLLPAHARATAVLSAREAGVVAGRACVLETYAQLDRAISVDWLATHNQFPALSTQVSVNLSRCK